MDEILDELGDGISDDTGAVDDDEEGEEKVKLPGALGDDEEDADLEII